MQPSALTKKVQCGLPNVLVGNKKGKLHIGPQIGLFFNPLIMPSLLDLIRQSRRLRGCFEILKLASRRLSTGLLGTILAH